MPRSAKPQKTAAPDFEAALAELERIVVALEQGDLTLEAALKQFERGIALTRQCQKALKEAEQKVEILLGHEGEDKLETFPRDGE